jgi:hypothetical protein
MVEFADLSQFYTPVPGLKKVKGKVSAVALPQVILEMQL